MILLKALVKDCPTSPTCADCPMNNGGCNKLPAVLKPRLDMGTGGITFEQINSEDFREIRKETGD